MSLTRYQKYKKSYQAYHKANREAILERQRKWREKHPNYLKEYLKTHPKMMNHARRKWRSKNRHKKRIFDLVYHNPQRYPLDSECAFCGVTEKLEHGHLDYEDDGDNYVTVCHACNIWMGKPIGD